MADKSFVKFKEIVHDVVDNNGNIRSVPIGAIKLRNLGEERLNVIKSLVNLLLKTDVLREETRMYLMDRDISMAKVYRNMKEAGKYEGTNITEKKVINWIYYDQAKIDSCLGENIVVDLLNKSVDYTKYFDNITNMFSKYADSGYRDKLILDLNKDVISTYINDEDFNEFLRAIYPYSKECINNVTNKLNEGQIGYFNYLVSYPNEYLSDVDKENKMRLFAVLKGIHPDIKD